MARGRPNVYEEKVKPHKRAIIAMRESGIDYTEIAKLLNVARSTLFKHRNEFEDLSDSTKKGDSQLIDKLEATLYDLALGRVKTTKTKIIYNPDNTIRHKEITEEQLSPDRVAVFFALTNLAPDKWKHKNEITLPDNVMESDMEQFDE